MNDEGCCCTLAVNELERSLCGASGLYTEYAREVSRSNVECSEAVVVVSSDFAGTLRNLTVAAVKNVQCQCLAVVGEVPLTLQSISINGRIFGGLYELALVTVLVCNRDDCLD